MSQQIIRYGLLGSMRTFETPTDWSGTEELETTGLRRVEKHVSHDGALLANRIAGIKQAFTVLADVSEATLMRTVNGAAARECTIFVPDNVHVTITETISGSGTFALATTLVIGKNASVTYRVLQQMSDTSIALLSHYAKLTDAKLSWLHCSVGSATTQASVQTHCGANAAVTTDAVVVGSAQQQFDVHTLVYHNGKHSQSNMRTRCVLDGSARVTGHGLIHIAPDAFEVDSYEKLDALLLSPSASAQAIPNLEIHDYRVRCSHGASIGRLDEEKLFYLRSRGITQEQAKRMATEGFVGELVPSAWLDVIRTKLGFQGDA
jgi:Fe-S cluster assembly protein SufD